jgi:hypothetical protein
MRSANSHASSKETSHGIAAKSPSRAFSYPAHELPIVERAVEGAGGCGVSPSRRAADETSAILDAVQRRSSMSSRSRRSSSLAIFSVGRPAGSSPAIARPRESEQSLREAGLRRPDKLGDRPDPHAAARRRVGGRCEACEGGERGRDERAACQRCGPHVLSRLGPHPLSDSTLPEQQAGDGGAVLLMQPAGGVGSSGRKSTRRPGGLRRAVVCERVLQISVVGAAPQTARAAFRARRRSTRVRKI